MQKLCRKPIWDLSLECLSISDSCIFRTTSVFCNLMLLWTQTEKWITIVFSLCATIDFEDVIMVMLKNIRCCVSGTIWVIWQKNMANFDLETVMAKYTDKTVLAISPRIINQITAEKLAKEEMFRIGARLLPANAKYHIYWFNKKIQRHPIRTYVVFDYPAPPQIEGHHTWSASDLEDSLHRAHGRFIKHSNR